MARPGRMRDSLEALLKTMPLVKIVCQEDDSSDNNSMALEQITECSPDLVLLVTDLSNDGSGQILEYLKDVPGTQCLVLTNTVLNLGRAKAVGADEVLLTGFTTKELFESVARLFSSGDEQSKWRPQNQA